jgi:hypothetical protein
MIITDSNEGKKLVEYLDTGEYKKILLPSWHGVGDLVMFMAPIAYLRKLYPNIQIDVGLAKGLQEEVFFPGVVLLEGDWRESLKTSDYDLIFACNMPLEDSNNTTKTKAEVCCEQELGISPIWGHLYIKPKKLVAVHFHNTSVSSVANCSEEIAQKIWNEIIEADCIPIETLFRHGFHNPINEKFSFINNHCRDWTANLDTLISIISHCDYFIGVVSGNFHLALSLLPYQRVALIENKLKSGNFTKLPIKTFDINNYKEGEVLEWLQNTHI